MSDFVYLRELDEQEKHDADILVGNSIDSLPYTLAAPVKRLFDHVAANEYGKAMNYALDFVEMSVQYLSMLLLVRLIEIEKDLPSEQRRTVRIVNKIDGKRPLSLGDWVNDILTPLVLISKERMPEDALVQSLLAHLMRKQTCVLLGDKREPSVVQIRNEYRGHSTTLSENIYRGVIYTLEPRIITLLRAMSPLQQYGFHSSPSEGRKLTHKGAGASVEGPCEAGEMPGHYYVSDGKCTTDMFPLIMSNENGYVYIFQTLKEESVSFISSNEDAVTYVDDSFNDDFDELMQRVAPQFDISKDLNWEQFSDLAKAESERYLARIYREKKYNRELFVDREQISAALDVFYDSPATFFPILGEAGQGKTNQLCFWTERLIEENKCVLIFSSADFASVTLDAHLKNIFGFSPRKDIVRLLDTLHDKAVQRDQYVYVFFDALNECLHYKDDADQMGVVALYKAIVRLFVNERYDRFKVVSTCRSYTWKHALSRLAQKEQHLTFAEDNGLNSAIRGFTSKELKKAYGIYQELYQMTSEFESLTPTAKIRLKDPLILKIACTNYLCKALPEKSKDFTSVALFNRMFNDIASSYAGKAQCRIIELIASHLLERYEQGIASDSISESELKLAYDQPENPLYKLAHLIFKRDGISVAYTELINKPERPVLRISESAQTGERQIQFIYERFLEYVMARVFVARETSDGSISTPIPAHSYLRCLARSAGNVVYMGAMRNALAIDVLRTHDYSTLISMMRDYPDDYEVMLLVGEVTNTLIAENYEQELFALTDLLLAANVENGDKLTQELNRVNRLIESNKADDQVIEKHKSVQSELMPVIRLRRNATVSVLNGVFATDYFNESLYVEDPYRLLWKLLDEPITEIRNDAVMYIYYLSVRTHTLDYTLLDENIAEKIVGRMFDQIRSHSLAGWMVTSGRRNMLFSRLETSIRLTVLMIIDTLLSKKENSRDRAAVLLGHITSIFSHITGNFALIRVVMPFLQYVMRKQLTFQSAYVNNIIEYQGFWDDSIVPLDAEEGKWSRQAMCRLLPMLMFNNSEKSAQDDLTARFRSMHPAVLEAYATGDSMSYFVLERIMVIMGVADWDNVRPVVNGVFEKYRQNEWFDYTQMSILYSLYQISVYGPLNRELIDMYAREARDWTLRTRGLFRARNSYKANTLGLYKRNVMNWYAVVYCTHSGDGMPLEGDERCVPLFYRMLDQAIEQNDKVLLFHLIENISELITDFGYIRTALDMLLYILKAYDTSRKVETLDAVETDRDGIYALSLVSLIGNVLSTAKNYFADEVDSFIKRDIVGLTFPGISKYREQILSFNPSGESLSDLFTHKFGNFLMWSLLNEPSVEQFSIKAMSSAYDSKDCFEWFDKVIRILVKDMFNAKI